MYISDVQMCEKTTASFTFAVFLLSPIYSMYGESIVMVKKFDVEIFVELSVLRSPESKKVVYKKCLSVCVCVFVSVHIARDQTDGPIFLKFGMYVQFANIS